MYLNLKMSNKGLLVLIVAVVLVGGAYFAYKYSNNTNMPGSTATPSTSQNITSPGTDSSQMAPTASASGDTMAAAVVSATSSGYQPQTITVKAGTKVTWTNASGAMSNVSSDPHPVHTDYPPLNLGGFANGESASLLFDKPGTYKYHNHLNATQRGTVIVQ